MAGDVRIDALKELARGPVATDGGNVFGALARSLAKACRTNGAFVGELTGESRQTLRIIGQYPDEPACAAMVFELADAPCREVIHQNLGAHLPASCQCLPHQAMLAAFGFAAYMGLVLCNVEGEPIGVLGVVHAEPIADGDVVESLLKIAAGRAEAELARWRSDALLTETRQRLEHILRVSPAVNYVLCAETGHTLWIAEGITALAGYTVEEAMRPSWWAENLHPEDRERAIAASAQLTTPRHLVHKYRFRHRDGSYRWIRDELRHVDAGDRQEIVGAWSDVTGQMLAEDARSRSEERYRLLAENSTDVIAVYIPLGKLQYVSPACRQVLGYDPEELVGQPALDWVHPDDMPAILASRAKLEGGASDVKSEYRVRRKDGEYVWLEVITRAIRDPQTGAVLVHMMSARDMTDRKRTEEELAALSRQRELILQSAGEGIYGVDREGRITFINRAGARMLGYRPDELIGVSVTSQACRLSGSPFPAAECLSFPLSPQGQAASAPDEIMWRSDGTGFLAEYTSMPIEEGGETLGAVITFNDVSARRKAESELRAAFAELQTLSRLKDEFLSTVSHELRTPLAAIKSAVSILAKERAGTLTESQARFVGIIEAHVARLNRMVDDVLDFQKMEAGLMDFHLECGEVRPVLEAAAGSMAHLFEAQGITFTLAVQDGAPAVDFDRHYLTQVLLNLLSNAAKFTPAGGQVALRASHQPEAWLVEVEDTGCGISAEHMARLFEKFYQVDGGLTRQAAGTGLGLAICKHIIEGGHGGRMHVRSVLGRGSTFSFTLPMRRL